jgi:hypothetical protein
MAGETGFTTAILEDLHDHVLGVAAMSQPAGQYCALFIGDPLNGGAECTGTDYARESVTFGAAATVGQVITSANSAIIDFGTAGSGGWGTVTHFAIYSAITDGTLLGTGELSEARAIVATDPVKFNIGECKMISTRINPA